ncbi:MAG TPA: response regulator transcription factor [Cyclobacteriaceae bacterium]|jgi:DNA-binding response OmpR family regulator|nr:response regulator transcription factor [Cyclobacteriaceae bacterium]
MSKIKILYVEDEPFLGRIVKESLEGRDYEVHMVTDGNEVINKFKTTKPDICVLDIMLPHVDGYSLGKNIRQLSPTTPIIFVTAKTQTEDVIKGFEVGGNDYLRKPFSMEELIVRINNLLQLSKKSSSNGQESIIIGKFEFSPNRYELKNGELVRKLSHKEAILLQILCENKNMTANRKDILLRVWGDDSFFNSRNLDVYITKLRDFLKDDPAIEIITIKGVGYHFSIN